MQYRLKVSGAQKQVLSLVAWPITMALPVNVWMDWPSPADGTVGCPPDSTKNCGQRMKGAELKLTYTPGIGEIYRHALVSEDHKLQDFLLHRSGADD